MKYCLSVQSFAVCRLSLVACRLLLRTICNLLNMKDTKDALKRERIANTMIVNGTPESAPPLELSRN